jgi:hypothetical protein
VSRRSPGFESFGPQHVHFHFAPLPGRPILAHLDVVRLLLARGADPNVTAPDGQALVFSALDKPKVLELLVEAGADLEVVDAEGLSPLLLITRPAAVWSSRGDPVEGGSERQPAGT